MLHEVKKDIFFWRYSKFSLILPPQINDSTLQIMEIKKSKKANLESRKTLFFEIGLALTLVVVLVAFEWPSYEKGVSMLDDDRKVTTEEEMISIMPDEPPPPPEPPKVPVMRDEFILVDDDVKIDDNIIIASEDDKNLGVAIMDYVATVQTDDAVEDDIPFAVVEDKPKFMGGDENEFTKWVHKQINARGYPESAKENGVQGRVTIEFVVTATGEVTGVKVLRGVDPALDKQAVQVISASPKWTPGKQRGKAVRVKYMFPVVYQLR
jgi:protein TonB